MVGVKRVPTNIMELRGSFKTHPERKRIAEPDPGEFPKSPPKKLTAAEKRAWKHIVDVCAPGVLKKSDQVIVEVTAVLIAEMRELRSKFPASRLIRLEQNLGRLGMTPSDRSRVIVEKKKTNAFDDL